MGLDKNFSLCGMQSQQDIEQSSNKTETPPSSPTDGRKEPNALTHSTFPNVLPNHPMTRGDRHVEA